MSFSLINADTNLKAITIGEIAYNRSRKEGYLGRIKGIFKRSLLIVDVNNKPISIVWAGLPNGPINIRLMDNLSPEMGDIQIGEKIIKKNSVISISSARALINIDISMAIIWRPNFFYVKNRCSQSIDHIYLSLNDIKNILKDYSEKMRIPHSSNFTRIAEIYMAQHVRLLVKYILIKDTAKIKNQSEKLVGLGFGLTPFGDDFLVGLISGILYTANALDKDLGYAIELNDLIIKYAKGKTNLISEDLMVLASKGLLNEPHCNLINGILSGDKEKVLTNTLEVLSIGNSSGRFFIEGMIWGIELWLKLK